MKLYRSKLFLIVILLFTILNIKVNLEILLATVKNPSDIYVPILCYHRVAPKTNSIYDLTPEMLEKQFQFYQEHEYHPITASQYLKFQSHMINLPEKPVVLTFDDGNKDHYEYVFPLLKKYGFKATFFVYPQVVSDNNNHSFITWDELSEMMREGMDIQAHSFSHPFLTSTKTRADDPHYLKWLSHELKDSKRIIEQKLKNKVELLAYPYGWFNCVVEEKVFESNYQGAFSVNWGVNLPDENPFRLKRRTVSQGLNLAEIQQYLESRPLLIEVISPRDASILSETPEVKFKLLSQPLHQVNIIIDNYKGTLTPDEQGIFTFTKFKTLRSGYYMIIVSGYDNTGQLYINSWGFDYQKSLEKSKKELKFRNRVKYE